MASIFQKEEIAEISNDAMSAMYNLWAGLMRLEDTVNLTLESKPKNGGAEGEVLLDWVRTMTILADMLEEAVVDWPEKYGVDTKVTLTSFELPQNSEEEDEKTDDDESLVDLEEEEDKFIKDMFNKKK